MPDCAWLATAGEIVVFNIDGRDIPIVHRVIKVWKWGEGRNVYADSLPSARNEARVSLAALAPKVGPGYRHCWFLDFVCMC
jgi:hypothetical protein